MKKTILIALAAMLTLATYAQQPGKPMQGRGGGPGMMHGKPGMEKMKQELNLTEAQQKEMKTLQESFRAKMKDLMDNEKITVKEQRDRRYKLGQEHRAAMQQVLTDEQKQKMTAMRDEQAKKMQERQGRHFEEAAADLKLTDNQQEQIKQLHEKHMAAVKSVRDNEGLDRTARETTLKNLMEQHKAAIKKVLSKDQFEQWEKMRKEYIGKGLPGRGRPGMRGPGMPGHRHGGNHTGMGMGPVI